MKPISNETYEGDPGKQYVIENEDDLYNFLSCIEALQTRAAEIGTAMLKLNNGKGSLDATDITFDGTSISAEYEEYLGCNEWDVHGIDIPLSYFTDDGYIEKAKEKIRKMKEEQKRKAEAAAAKRKKEAEDRERKKYLELKAKFENDEMAKAKANVAGEIAKGLLE